MVSAANLSTTKQGKHGTLHLYEIVYTDTSDDCIGELTTRQWGYNREHVEDTFYQSVDADGWTILRTVRK